MARVRVYGGFNDGARRYFSLAILLAFYLRLGLRSPLRPNRQSSGLAFNFPITDALLGRSLVRFKEAVEKRSDNAISVEIFDKGKLYIDDQTVGAVESGAIEMGVAGLNQFAKRIPAIDIMEQPFLFNFEALVQATASPESEIRKLIDKTILDAVGVRVLWWQSVGNQIFIAKGTTTTEPHQIKGQKIRVFSPTHGAVRRSIAGAAPSWCPPTRPRTPFTTREIEMATGASSLIANRQLWTVADTITRTLHAPIEFFLIVNEKVWRSLPEDHRAIIAEVARAEEQQSRRNVTEIEAGLYTDVSPEGHDRA